MTHNKYNKEERMQLEEEVYALLRYEHILSAKQISDNLRLKPKEYGKKGYRHMTPQYLNKMILPDMLKDKRMGKIAPMSTNEDYDFKVDVKSLKEALKNRIEAWKGLGEKPALYFPYEFTNTILKPLFLFYDRFKEFDNQELGKDIRILEGIFCAIDMMWRYQKKQWDKKGMLSKASLKEPSFSGNPFIDELLKRIIENKELSAHIALTSYSEKKDGKTSLLDNILNQLNKISISIDKMMKYQNFYSIINQT